MKKAAAAFLAFFLCLAARVEPAYAYKLDVGGSYKNLFSSGKTVLNESYWADLNRLRLDADLAVSDSFSAKIVYDNEAVAGTAIKTSGFEAGKNAAYGNLYDLKKTVADRGDVFWSHSLYRAYAMYKTGKASLTTGRQRIYWGQARVWNVVDLFNPISPLAIESNERVGIDAVSLEVFPGPLSAVNAVYAPGRAGVEDKAGLRFRSNFKGYDFSILGGDFGESGRVLGADFAGNLKGGGLRGEFAFTDASGRADFSRFVLGLDYNFERGIYCLLEYLHNGGNIGDDAEAAKLASFGSEVVTRNRNFLAASAGYDFTPLVRGDLFFVYDIDEGGLFMNPLVRYNILTDLDLSAGVQVFSDRGEYEGFSDVYYFSAELYF